MLNAASASRLPLCPGLQIIKIIFNNNNNNNNNNNQLIEALPYKPEGCEFDSQ